MTEKISIKLQNPLLVKQIKTILENKQLISKNHKILKKDDIFIIFTTIDYTKCEKINQILCVDESILKELAFSKYINASTNTSILEAFVIKYIKSNKITVTESITNELVKFLPKKWSIYPPMVLLNTNTFDCAVWNQFLSQINSNDFFKQLIDNQCFGSSEITHIAINKPIIEQDIMRRPFNLVPIFGDFGPEPDAAKYGAPTSEDFKKAFWCSVVQNGIYQTWAPRYTMFSRGNIKEKARVLNFESSSILNQTVVDLYAGIGYFTLSYLKKGGKLFCWEINPWSIEGLVRGVSKNGFTYKVMNVEGDAIEDVDVHIFAESNEFAPNRFKQMGIKFPITHINLGLLPSSQPSWPISIELINQYSDSSSTTIHIHENINIREFTPFLETTKTKLESFTNNRVQFLHIEKIKTFAPDVWHICADFKIIKPN